MSKEGWQPAQLQGTGNGGSDWMRIVTLVARKGLWEEGIWGEGRDVGSMLGRTASRTSCGRTSGRGCCTPRPAAAAPRPGSSRRWTPPGGCGWARGWRVSGHGRLPCPATPGRGREGRGPTEQGEAHDTWLKRKNLRIGGNGGCAWRGTQKLVGTVQGHCHWRHQEEVSGRGWDPCLLVVPTKPGAKLHEGREGVSSGGWQGHMGLQHSFQ